MESACRVLLVDDADNLRRLLAKVLESGGFEVIEFSNSPDALAWSESNDLDVLVTDVTLDGISGPALAQAVVKRHPHLLVIFISGYPLDVEAERANHLNSLYLAKPFPPRVLLSTIVGFLEQRQRSSEA